MLGYNMSNQAYFPDAPRVDNFGDDESHSIRRESSSRQIQGQKVHFTGVLGLLSGSNNKRQVL